MAGEQINADGQLEVRGLLLGKGTVYDLPRQGDTPALEGMFEPVPVKAGDVDLHGQDGAVATRDYRGVREVAWLIRINAPTVTVLEQRAAALETAMDVSSEDDVELHCQWWGRGHVYVVGRPRGAQLVASNLAVRQKVYRCTFVAQDPRVHTYTP